MDSRHASSIAPQEAPSFIREFKPAPVQLDEIYNQFLQVLALGREWKKLIPLMDWFNNQHISEAGKLTADEVQEALDELEMGQLRKFLAEWADSLNLAAGLERGKNLQIHYPSEVFAYVNGQGRRNNVYEQAQEIALNFSSRPDQLRKDVIEFFTLMSSGLIHAPQFTENLVQLSLEKMQDNLKNYPAELYGITDEAGKLLNPDQLAAKYEHLYKCLKWLRGLYQPARMLPSDWREVKSYMLAFQSSDEAFRMLQTRWFELHPELQTILVAEQQDGDTQHDFEGVPDYV